MSVRITSTTAKVGIVILAVVVALPIATVTAIVTSTATGMLAAAVLLATIVIFAARVFRAKQEPVAPPRPWWKMTGTSRPGYAVAALFVVQATYVLGTPLEGESVAVRTFPTAVLLIVAAAYVHSSIRMGGDGSPGRSQRQPIL